MRSVRRQRGGLRSIQVSSTTSSLNFRSGPDRGERATTLHRCGPAGLDEDSKGFPFIVRKAQAPQQRQPKRPEITLRTFPPRNDFEGWS